MHEQNNAGVYDTTFPASAQYLPEVLLMTDHRVVSSIKLQWICQVKSSFLSAVCVYACVCVTFLQSKFRPVR